MTANALNDFRTFSGWAADYYEPLAIRHYDRAIAAMLRLLAPPPGSEVLDAGCGTGVHAVRVARAGFRVHAIDISQVALNDAKVRAVREGVGDQVKFEQADLTRLPFQDAHFQSIFSWGVLIHIPEMEAALQELVRVLRPGGRLAVQLTNGASIDQRVERLARRLLRRPKPRAEQTRFGLGAWDQGPAGQLWTVHTDIREFSRCLNDLGCRLAHRRASEFTEMQRHFRGWPRKLLRHLNTAWFAMGLPAWAAATNLLVFEKAAD